MPDRHLALVGLPGVGKTTVGRLIADELGRALIDTDDRLAAVRGRPVPDLWNALGEPAFRAAEAEVVIEVLESEPPAVVSLGGGAVTTEAVRQGLAASAWVAWLDAAPAVLADRLAADEVSRPVVGTDDPTARLGTLAAERAALYEAVAAVRFDADRPAADVAEDVLGHRVEVTAA